MKSKNYGYMVNVAGVVAVVSALSYDAMHDYKWLAFFISGIAAVVGLALYFRLHWMGKSDAEIQDVTTQEINSEHITNGSNIYVGDATTSSEDKVLINRLLNERLAILREQLLLSERLRVSNLVQLQIILKEMESRSWSAPPVALNSLMEKQSSLRVVAPGENIVFMKRRRSTGKSKRPTSQAGFRSVAISN